MPPYIGTIDRRVLVSFPPLLTVRPRDSDGSGNQKMCRLWLSLERAWCWCCCVGPQLSNRKDATAASPRIVLRCSKSYAESVMTRYCQVLSIRQDAATCRQDEVPGIAAGATLHARWVAMVDEALCLPAGPPLHARRA